MAHRLILRLFTDPNAIGFIFRFSPIEIDYKCQRTIKIPLKLGSNTLAQLSRYNQEGVQHGNH